MFKLKQKNTVWASLALLAIFLLISSGLDAQCSMCGKTAMDAMKDGNTASRKLNQGILYLMSGPYVVVATIVLTFYIILRRKKKQMDAEGFTDFF
ncbi:MAG: hypothetical protein ACI959_001967 [Limisphaerales bacterium]|jgi:hypothetical protein